MPLSEAHISPLDRGFLFGDGLYEVIPSDYQRLIGWSLHMARLRTGLAHIALPLEEQDARLEDMAIELLRRNPGTHQAVYLHVSRGVDSRRFHGFSAQLTPTIFAYVYDLPNVTASDAESVRALSVVTQQDLRWQRCHIKSTSLLGNVLHFQHSYAAGYDETLLLNREQQITEASACNVFAVYGQRIVTPPLDNQLLAGITRQMTLDILARHSDYEVTEAALPLNDIWRADEVWLTSSTKDIVPVVSIDDRAVGNGEVGAVWQHTKRLYDRHKFDY